jgi:hypothetical protein
MTTKFGIIAGALWCGLLVAGCAASKPSMYKLADPKDRIICRDEVPLGSIIPKRRCNSIKELEQAEQAARREMRTASEKTNKSVAR